MFSSWTTHITSKTRNHLKITTWDDRKLFIERIITTFSYVLPGKAALADSGVTYNKIQSVVASYCYGDPTCGQRAVYELGLTGVPVYNVNNNCSSGSTALMMARRLIQSGVEDCVMALGD